MISTHLEGLLEAIDHKSSFMEGIEVGMVWSAMEEGTRVIKGRYSKDSFELFIRMATEMEYYIEKEDLEAGEIDMTFTRKKWL